MQKSPVELSLYQHILYNINKFGDLNVAGTIFIDNDLEVNLLNREIIKNVLNILQIRHPFLRAFLNEDEATKTFSLRIIDPDESVFFKDKVQVEMVDLRNESDYREAIIKNIERFNSKIFEGDHALLWRCQVILYKDVTIKYCITLVISTLITDGMNILTLLIEMTNILNCLLTNTECEEMKVRLSVANNLHEFCEENKFLDTHQMEVIRDMNKKTPVKFKFPSKFRSRHEEGLKINLLKFNKDMTINLINKVKEKGLKLTGVLTTAMLYSLRELYLENKQRFPEELSIGIPASLRFRYNQNLDSSEMGFHVCMVDIETNKNKFGKFKDFWTDSKYINDLVKENTDLNEGKIFATTHNLKFYETLKKLLDVISWGWLVKRVANHVNVSDIALSNVGRYVYDSKKPLSGPFKITEMYFGDSYTSKPNMLCSLCFYVLYWNDELMIRLSSNKCSFNSVYADRISVLFEQFIKNVLDETD